MQPCSGARWLSGSGFRLLGGRPRRAGSRRAASVSGFGAVRYNSPRTSCRAPRTTREPQAVVAGLAQQLASCDAAKLNWRAVSVSSAWCPGATSACGTPRNRGTRLRTQTSPTCHPRLQPKPGAETQAPRNVVPAKATRLGTRNCGTESSLETCLRPHGHHRPPAAMAGEVGSAVSQLAGTKVCRHSVANTTQQTTRKACPSLAQHLGWPPGGTAKIQTMTMTRAIEGPRELHNRPIQLRCLKAASPGQSVATTKGACTHTFLAKSLPRTEPTSNPGLAFATTKGATHGADNKRPWPSHRHK